MNDFLHQERDGIAGGVPSPVPAESNPTENAFGNSLKREIGKLDVDAKPIPTTSGRHSLTKCTCEKCQARRVKLARAYGIAVVDTEDSEETEEDILLDEKTLAKIVTVYHTYRFVSLPSPIREAWEVSKESEEMFGRLSRKILAKYLRKADFPYKDELILSAFLVSDISIRFLHEAKLKSLEGGK